MSTAISSHTDTAAAADLTTRKFHASLNVSDLGRSIAFYRALFGLDPAKVRSDYAKFELDEPPLVLSLIPGRPGHGGNLNHVGLRVRSADELVQIQTRLEAAGLGTTREDGVECCYARQTKFWVTDPDRALWEIYVFHEDIDEHGEGEVPHVGGIEAQEDTAAARTVWEHRIPDPVPDRIPHEDNAVHAVRLEGTLNLTPEAAKLGTLFGEAFRVLQPGGFVRIHGLAGDRPLTAALPLLPGPAAVVQHVPAGSDVMRAMVAAGLVDVRFEQLSKKAHFTVDGVPMRELALTGFKPGYRPKTAAHQAIYLGPLAQVTDDFGNVFVRGEPTRLNVHDWQVLERGPAAGEFLLLAPEAGTPAPLVSKHPTART